MARCPWTTAALSSWQTVPLHQRLSQACGSRHSLQRELERQPSGSPLSKQMCSPSSRQPPAGCTAWHGRRPWHSNSSKMMRRRGRPCHRRSPSPCCEQSRPSRRQHRRDRAWTQRAGTRRTGAAARWPCCSALQLRKQPGMCARPSSPLKRTAEGCAAHGDGRFARTLCWYPQWHQGLQTAHLLRCTLTCQHNVMTAVLEVLGWRGGACRRGSGLQLPRHSQTLFVPRPICCAVLCPSGSGW